MQIITRAEARAQGKARYFTGKPCRYGHLDERFTRDSKCLTCSRQHSAKSRSKHISARRAADREYASKNSEKRRLYAEKYRAANQEKLAIQNRVWVIQNPEKRRELHRRYHAAKVQATPTWVNRRELEYFYLNRPEGMEVDHIVPLQGENVCGLHVPWNLQYLSPLENAAKGNRFF